MITSPAPPPVFVPRNAFSTPQKKGRLLETASLAVPLAECVCEVVDGVLREAHGRVSLAVRGGGAEPLLLPLERQASDTEKKVSQWAGWGRGLGGGASRVWTGVCGGVLDRHYSLSVSVCRSVELSNLIYKIGLVTRLYLQISSSSTLSKSPSVAKMITSPYYITHRHTPHSQYTHSQSVQ